MINHLTSLLKSNLTFLFVIIIFTLLKIFLSFVQFDLNDSIYDLGFGFGNYIESLTKNHQYSWDVGNNLKFYSSRMPGLPIFIFIIGFVSKSQLIVSIIKNIIQSLILYFSLNSLVNQNEKYKQIINSFFLIICLFPNIIKHMSQINYEEGFIYEYLIILLFYLMTLSRKNIHSNFSIIILFSFLIFFFKSSMLVVFISTIFYLIFMLKKSEIKIFKDLKSVLTLTFIIITLGIWTNHNIINRDRLTIMTSWEGANFYRGSSEEGLKIFPEYNLDLLMSGPHNLKLKSGEIIEIPYNKRRNEFINEDHWNDFYKEKGISWIKSNPLQYLNFFLNKINNFFLSVEFSPKNKNKSIEIDSLPRSIFLYYTKVWLILGRIISLIFIYSFFVLFRKNKKLIIINLLLVGSYSIPYIVGFNYERHITGFLILVLGSLIFYLVSYPKIFKISDEKNLLL